MNLYFKLLFILAIVSLYFGVFEYFLPVLLISLLVKFYVYPSKSGGFF